MANRKFLIESILGLAQKIGANPNKFMGTKGNINFLGTGDRAMKDTTFSGALNKDFLNLGVTKDDIIKVIEKDAGYVTADKLNDMQLKTMYDNLIMVDSRINPIQNIVKFPEGGINSIPINKQFGGEGITSLKNIEKSGGAGGSAPLTETLTKNETRYLNELIGDTGGGQFTSDIMEEVPSLRIKGNKITVDKKDIDSFKNYLDDLYISELAPSGPGANFMPPRLRAQTADNDLLIKLLRSEKADGGRIGYRSGKSVKGIAELLKLGKGQLKTADKIDRPASAKLSDEFERFNKRSETYGGPYSDDYYRKSLETEELVNVDELPIELLDAEAIMVKYPGITERLARLIGNDTNLQRKAEALSAIDQAMALRGAGKSADETIAILKSEPETKMKKGGLAQILEM